MKKSKTFKIAVPKPCSEHWEQMEERERGRFCQSCKNIIIDFSQLPNKELYEFFQQNKNIICGRFSSNQLNIDLTPPAHRKNSFYLLYLHVAAIVAFFTLKNSVATDLKKDKVLATVN